jgi:hypothetical protein
VRWIKRLLKVIGLLIAVLVISAVVAVAWIELGCRPASVEASPPPSLPIEDPAYRRTGANTYFTFPEWYIVYSFEDFGRFLEVKSESQFPYISQIAGFWRSFCDVNRVASAMPGDHGRYKLMIHVIGLSYSVEYVLVGIYENTVGRLTEWLRGPRRTAEDNYARSVTQDYGAFLSQVPWYEYPFMDKLAGLWRDTPIIGNSPLRSVERKLSLSAQYLLKAGYAKLIKLGLAATTPPADLVIMFVVKGDGAGIQAREPTVRVVTTLPDGNSLLIAPRYAAFTDLLKRLADAGDEIVEIAGNRRILMTAVVPDGSPRSIPGSREIFSFPVDASPGFSRVGFELDVGRLSPVLRAFKSAGVEVEHLYDY